MKAAVKALTVLTECTLSPDREGMKAGARNYSLKKWVLKYRSILLPRFGNRKKINNLET